MNPGADLGRLQGLRLLIVDDEEDFASALASRLELRGMRVACAPNGRDGLAALAVELPDVLLLDMRMPGMSGVEVLEAVRSGKAAPAGESLPVVIVSGHAEESDFARATELGIQGYVAKPVNFDELLAAIVRSVRRGAGVDL